ncbi:MAG: zinc-ribbon domain-containing protein [Clostridia bacterium]|jgi:rubrerythrin|nr:zinc-ribbon domain-containing protein [Clostridia bacterium]
MSFFKKLGETAMNTASTIGSKSANLVETGKLKLAKNQLEGKIDDKKLEIGDLVYAAYKAGSEPDNGLLQNKFNEIEELESQIRDIEAQLEQPKENVAATADMPDLPQELPAEPSAAKFCSNCGNALDGSVKFCPNCGKPTA